MIDGEDRSYTALREKLKELEAEIKQVRERIEGRPEYGWLGLEAKLNEVNKRHADLQDVVKEFEEREERRSWEQEQIRKRSERFQKFGYIAFSGLITVVTGLVLAILTQIVGV